MLQKFFVFALLIFHSASNHAQVHFPRWSIAVQAGYGLASSYDDKGINAHRAGRNVGISFGRMSRGSWEAFLGIFYEENGYSEVGSGHKDERAVDYITNQLQLRYYFLLNEGLFLSTGLFDDFVLNSYTETRKPFDYGLLFGAGYRKIFRNKFGLEAQTLLPISLTKNGDTRAGKNISLQFKLGVVKVF